MRKYEALLYIRSLGLPTVLCREFVSSERIAMLSYFDLLTSMDLRVGVRTDYAIGKEAGVALPLIPSGGKDKLLEVVNKYGNELTYLLSEAPKKSGITVYGTVNVNPGLNLLLAYNDLPGIPTCRHAIEYSRYQHGIKYLEISFADFEQSYPVWVNRLREYIKRAWMVDSALIGKRIEFSLYHDYKRFVFWQVSADPLR